MPNGRSRRGHGFFFSPRDYLNDPAVLAMSLEARGAYSTLLFAIWDLDEPGVVVATDAVLATLSRATPEEWLRVRSAIAQGFDTESRPGWWVQKRMVFEHQRQDRYYSEKRRLGKLGADKRWDGRAMAEPSLTYSASPASPASPDATSTPLAINGDRRVGSAAPPKTDPKAEWLEAFSEFYDAYPRKVKPDAARRAYLAIKPWTQEKCNEVMAGVEAWKSYWRSRETPKDKIPYPASFLNAGQWKEPPE